ncbi:MAG: fimbrillin family protein [Bacteroidales bacterium]|nr:fimbrillin family protein [Bacteroidales bacterium]
MKRMYFVLLGLLLMMASCNQMETVYTAAPQAIEFASVVHPNTRVPMEGSMYRHVDSMRVSAYIADAEDAYKDQIGSFFEDILFYKNPAGDGWLGVQFWPLFSSNINFSLISQSYKTSNVDVSWGSPAASKAIVRLSNNNVLDQTDLMYGGGKGITDGKGNYAPVSVLFHHALSLVSFSFSSMLYEFVTIKKVELVASYNGTLTVDFDHDNTDAVMNHSTYATPSWQPDAPQSLTVPNTKYTGACEELLLTQVETSYGAPLMALPGNGNDRKIVITYNLKQSTASGVNEDKEYVYTHTVAEEWLPGKKYHYAIQLSPQALLVMPTMETWPTAVKNSVVHN